MTRFPGITPNMISGEGQCQVRAALSEGFCPFDSTALDQNGYCPVCTTRWTLHRDGIYSYTASFVYVPDLAARQPGDDLHWARHLSGTGSCPAV